MRNFAHTGKRNPLRDRDLILHVGRYPWCNHMCNFLWRSVKGFGRGKGSNFPFSQFPLTCVVALTTFSHYRASVWFISAQYVTGKMRRCVHCLRIFHVKLSICNQFILSFSYLSSSSAAQLSYLHSVVSVKPARGTRFSSVVTLSSHGSIGYLWLPVGDP